MGHATSRGPICWNPRRFRLFVPSDNERSMRIRWCNHASDPKRLLPASLYGDLVPAHGEPAEGAEDGNPPDSCGGRAVSLLEIWLKQIYVRIYLYIYIYYRSRERVGLEKRRERRTSVTLPVFPSSRKIFSVFSAERRSWRSARSFKEGRPILSDVPCKQYVISLRGPPPSLSLLLSRLLKVCPIIGSIAPIPSILSVNLLFCMWIVIRWFSRFSD